jgi:hypothetical protein
MNPKKTPSNRKPNTATDNIHAAESARKHDARASLGADRRADNAKKRPRYVIKSAPAKLSIDYGVGKTEPAWARVTLVVSSATGHVMAATIHFEPCCDLASSGGDPAYDPAKHAAAEIQHFRSLFPGLSN